VIDAFRLARRAGWNVVDQGLSAFSNVALAVMVARTVTASGFGAFSIAFLLFSVAVAVARSGVGQPLQIRFSGAASDIRDAAIRRALGCAVLMGLAGAALIGAAGALLDGQLRAALIALAVVLPGLLLQDSCRMAMFACGRPAAAALIDGVWAVVQIGLIAGCIAIRYTGLGELILAWGISAALSALLGVVVLRVVPAPQEGLSWLRGEGKLTSYLLGEYVLGLGAAQFGTLLVGFLASTSAVGSLRAAQVLLGPLGVLGAAAFQFSIPEIARRPDAGSRSRLLFALGLSAIMGSVTVGYVVLLLLLPDSVGSELFGSSWAGAASVLLAMGIGSLASSLCCGPAGVLYGMGAAALTFRIYVVKGPLLIVVVTITTLQWGVIGAAWGLAAMEIAVLPVYWFVLRSALRRGAGVPLSGDPDPEASLTPSNSHVPSERNLLP